MLRAFQQAVKTRGLIRRGEHVLIAVSGGADSVALTYALHYLQRKLDFFITVAHLNHGIRGPEASEDARFVAELAWSIGAACHMGEINVPEKAAELGISLEMAAREARYDFLTRIAREVGAQCVATAHTADDQVETIILKLARGAGPQGLSGIPWATTWNNVRIIRPLRGIFRKDIEAFLRAHGLKWREDRTNRDLHHLRNRVRHEILPLLEKWLNIKIREALIRMADIISEENALLDAHARKILKACRLKSKNAIVVRAVARHAPALRRRVLRLWLAAAGIPVDALDFELVEAVHRLLLDERGTRQIALPGGRAAMRRYEKLVLQPQAQLGTNTFSAQVSVPGETILPAVGLRVVALIGKGILRQTGARVGEIPAEASIDLDSVGHDHITVRSWRPGDRIQPLGMDGSRKLQDIFVDAKVPRDRRMTIPVFECRGEIIWIPGYRVARNWAVKDAAGPALHLSVSAW